MTIQEHRNSGIQPSSRIFRTIENFVNSVRGSAETAHLCHPSDAAQSGILRLADRNTHWECLYADQFQTLALYTNENLLTFTAKDSRSRRGCVFPRSVGVLHDEGLFAKSGNVQLASRFVESAVYGWRKWLRRG